MAVVLGVLSPFVPFPPPVPPCFGRPRWNAEAHNVWPVSILCVVRRLFAAAPERAQTTELGRTACCVTAGVVFVDVCVCMRDGKMAHFRLGRPRSLQVIAGV